MTTERKPGSRGVRGTFSGALTGPDQRNGSEPVPRQNDNPKGKTKTVSPRKAFKKRK